jgi:hypothetical protein
MYDPAPGACQVPEIPDPLARADALEREFTDLYAQINAAGYRLLVAELDDEAPWGAWGLSSCAHWLNWRCGIGLNAAREKVRVAHALRTRRAKRSASRTRSGSYRGHRHVLLPANSAFPRCAP